MTVYFAYEYPPRSQTRQTQGQGGDTGRPGSFARNTDLTLAVAGAP